MQFLVAICIFIVGACVCAIAFDARFLCILDRHLWLLLLFVFCVCVILTTLISKVTNSRRRKLALIQF